MVPEPDVLDGERVALERACVDRLVGRKAPLLDPVEAVGLARHPDVMGDEGPLGDELVRRHAEPLEQRRVHAESEHPHQAEHDHPAGDEPEPRARDLGEAEHGGDGREHGEHAERGERGVGVRVGGAEDDPARRENELEAVEPESDPLEREHQRPEDEQVCAGAAGEARPARGQDEAPLEHADDEGQDDRAGHEGDRPAVHETPERQDEDEEREVAAEERVGGLEGHRVEVAEHRLPVRRRAEPRGERDDADDDRQEPADQRLDHHPSRQAELVLELPDHVGRRRTHGEREVHVEEQEDAEGQGREERAAEGQDLGEDLRVPHLLEPEPVGVERDALGDQAERQKHDQQREHGLTAVHRAGPSRSTCRGSRRRDRSAARS